MAFLIFGWMILAWLAVMTGFLIVRYWIAARRKRRHPESDLPIAHSLYLTRLPEYAAALKRYRWLVRVTAGLLTLSLLASIMLTARPAALSDINPEQKNRDIMLCLDVSGSVLKEDAILTNRLSTLVKDFSGQRFGLTLFNSSAVSVIPLNDNYQLISKQLKITGLAFQSQKGESFTRLTDNTLVGYKSGTSLVGDGLTSCIQHMGANPTRRSQSIILATDNEVNGKPIIAMPQALEIALQRKIHIFTFDPGVSDPKLAGDHDQLKLIAKQTGGNYYQIDDSGVVSSLINDIGKQVPEQFVGVPQLAVNDHPNPFLFAAVLFAVGSLVMLWRLNL